MRLKKGELKTDEPLLKLQECKRRAIGKFYVKKVREVGRPKTEDRRRKTEDGRPKTEAYKQSLKIRI